MARRRATHTSNPPPPDYFPASARVLLTGGGKQFVERIGVTAIREVIFKLMLGENLRIQTEPLSRRRIAQVSGALVAMFLDGHLKDTEFSKKLSQLALDQLRSSSKNDNAKVWPAQWLLGLTGKSVQNVLRSEPEAFAQYIVDFEEAIREAAEKCRTELGDLKMTLGYLQDDTGRKVELDWVAITRLTTAIGAQTLTIRGSDKSIYGKLFERLVLGCFLTLIGFERVDQAANKKDRGVFWLSDSKGDRECDATILVSPGKLGRFDIGFIGPGNSEISKDKLSRFAREYELSGGTSSSVTFIVVDRLPKTGKTEAAADKINAEIVQMGMQYWPRVLARRIEERLGWKHPLSEMPDTKIQEFLQKELECIPNIADFLSGVSVQDMEDTGTGDKDDDLDDE